MHRQASNKFDTIEQGQKTVQELIQELTKHVAQMVQYLDDYLLRRWLIAALRPSLQKEVLHRGITAEFSSMQDILEKVKDIEDSLWYDIGSWVSADTTHSNVYMNHSMVKSSKHTARQVTMNRHPNLFGIWVAILVIYQKLLVNNLPKKVNLSVTNVARKDTCNLSVQNWGTAA